MSKRKKNEQKTPNERGSRFFRVIYALLSGVVGLIFRIKVVNAENEPREGGYLVCANHISATDPIMLSYAFRRHQVHFMAKKELFDVPVFSGFIRMLGAFPVDRGGGDVGALRNAIGIVKSGRCLGIFPQGHRYPECDPRETKTKNGAALVAARAEADIVPAYVWRKGNKSGAFKRTYVIIGERIPFESIGYTKEGGYSVITELVFDRICTLGESFDPVEYKKRRRSGK